jgi:hypothetical protein
MWLRPSPTPPNPRDARRQISRRRRSSPPPNRPPPPLLPSAKWAAAAAPHLAGHQCARADRHRRHLHPDQQRPGPPPSRSTQHRGRRERTLLVLAIGPVAGRGRACEPRAGASSTREGGLRAGTTEAARRRLSATSLKAADGRSAGARDGAGMEARRSCCRPQHTLPAAAGHDSAVLCRSPPLTFSCPVSSLSSMH